MCKILAVTGPLKRSAQERVLDATATLFSRSQRDGFGFVSHGKTTTARGRYLRPEMFAGFGFCRNLPEFLVRDVLEEGIMPEVSQVLLAHGRTSTNRTCVYNVHPFRRKSVYIIHNGILDWVGTKKNRPASEFGCDTEEFLNYLMAGNELYDAHEDWAGYGAIFILDSKSGKLTLAKCYTSTLYGAQRVKSGWVFSSEAADLLRIARAGNIQLRTRPIPFPQRLVFFGPDGNLAKDDSWQGFASRKWDKMSVASLGLTDEPDTAGEYDEHLVGQVADHVEVIKDSLLPFAQPKDVA